MIIGSCSLDFYIYNSNSLKDKRHVVKSIIDKVRNKYNVSIAEVDQLDSWSNCTIGFVCVSNSTSHTNRVISTVINYVESDGRIEITKSIIEIL